MDYLAVALFGVWAAGLLFLYGRWLNFTRLLYNNLDPAKDFSKTPLFVSHWFSRSLFSKPLSDARVIAPENLTELGRQYQQRAIRNERITLAWCLGGVVLFVIMLATSEDAFAIVALAVVLTGFYFLSASFSPAEGKPDLANLRPHARCVDAPSADKMIFGRAFQLVPSDCSGATPASCTECATILIAPSDSSTACASSAN